MQDPYLYVLMHGGGLQKKTATVSKSKWDQLIEEEMRIYIDSLHLEIRAGLDKLRSPAMEKARLKQEMKEALTYEKLTPFIKDALSFLQTSSSEYLEKGPLQELLENLTALPQIIDQATLEHLENKNFQEILKISDFTVKNIYKIAVAKFDEQQYDTCLALFVLLSTLNPLNEQLWLRQGIAAQKKEDYDLALSSYRSATELNPHLIEPFLFSIECYLRKELIPEARAAFQQLKLKVEEVDAASLWKEPITQIGNIFASLP